MASEKITAMPNLAGGQVPTDLIPAVDLSALPASQNVKTTLNDLFSTVTKNITDRAVRFQAAGSTPGLSTPTTGALYFDGSTFQASQNGGAWTALVLAGSITTCGLTQKTARILGRTTAGTGAIEEITIGSGLALAAGSLAASGLLTASGYTQNSGFLIGRSTAGVGAVEEISIGPGLTLTGGVLDATGGGGGTPGGSQFDVQFHDAGGTFGGSNNFQFKPTGNPTVSIRATSASHNVLDLTADVAQTAEVVLVKQNGDNTASLLALRQGPLSTLNSSFPLRFENASGTLILGLRSRPATGIYQFVSPGANLGTVVYEVGTLGSNNGLGLATGSQSPSIFAGNIQCVWWSGSTGNTVFNQAYQATWGSAPGTVDVGLSRPIANTLQVTNGTTGDGRLRVGGGTGTSSALSLGSTVNGVDVQCLGANRSTTQFANGTYIATSVSMNPTPSAAATGAVYIAGSNQIQSGGSSNILTLYGLQNIARHTGTGLCSAVAGLKCFAYLDTGTASELVAGDFQTQLLNATGVATASYGVKSQVIISAGTSTTSYGVFVGTVQGTTAYGVYVNNSLQNVTVGGSTNWTVLSDARFKNGITDYEIGLDTVLKLRSRRFAWNESSKCPGKRAVGFIAQEAQEVAPELVVKIETDLKFDDVLAIDASNVTHMLINSVKTLHQRISKLEELNG